MKEVTASQRKVESDSKLALEKEKLAWLREQCQESERLTEVLLFSEYMQLDNLYIPENPGHGRHTGKL